MKKVVVGIISRVNSRGEIEYLLASSKKDFGEFTGFYYPPGGHVEEGERVEEALVRELQEELQLIVEPLKEIAETKGDIADQVTYWWSCEVRGGEMKIDETEIADAGYFTKEQIEQMNIWPATKQFFETHVFNVI